MFSGYENLILQSLVISDDKNDTFYLRLKSLVLENNCLKKIAVKNREMTAIFLHYFDI